MDAVVAVSWGLTRYDMQFDVGVSHVACLYSTAHSSGLGPRSTGVQYDASNGEQNTSMARKGGRRIGTASVVLRSFAAG